MCKHDVPIRFASFVWLLSCAGVLFQPTPAAGQAEAVTPNPGSVEIGQTTTRDSLPADVERNAFLPGVSFATRTRLGSMGPGYDAHIVEGYLMGHLTFRRFSGRSGFTLDYSGGNSVSSGSSGTYSPVHALEFSRVTTGRRWAVSLGGSATYLPESSFGFGWGAGFSQPSVTSSAAATGGGTSAIQDAGVGQTILTTRVQRLRSSLRTRLEYHSSARSSWSMSGSYGRLDFAGGGYVDSSNVLLQAGYAHQLSRKDNVSISYGFEGFRFAGQAQSIEEHSVSISFSHRVSSGLNLQAAAGPSLSVFRNSVAAESSPLSYRIGGGFNYVTDRGMLGLNYDRFLASGSGVLVGSTTSQLQLTAGRLLTRSWQASAALGYAANRGFAQTGASAQTPLRSWYGSTKLSRRMGQGSLFLGYGVRSQGGYGGVACSGADCGASFVTQEISLGMSWSLRPIGL